MCGIRAAAAGAFITHMVETKGLDAIDKHKAKELGERSTRVQKCQR